MGNDPLWRNTSLYPEIRNTCVPYRDDILIIYKLYSLYKDIYLKDPSKISGTRK